MNLEVNFDSLGGGAQVQHDTLTLAADTPITLPFEPKIMYILFKYASDPTNDFWYCIYNKEYKADKQLCAPSSLTRVMLDPIPYSGSDYAHILSISGNTVTLKYSIYSEVEYWAYG